MNKKKIRILLVGPMHPSVGGIATYLSNVLSSNLAESFDLIPFSTSRPNKATNTNSTNCLAHNIFLYIFYLRCFIITLNHICMFPLIVIVKKPSIIHIHTASYFSFLENSIYVLMSKALQKKVILHIHGGSFLLFYNRSPYLLKVFIKFVLSISDQIICLSDYWKNRFSCEIGLNKDNFLVIKNGYNQSLFHTMDIEKCRKLLSLPADKKIILTVGNLSEVKGHKYLVESMSIVLKSRKDIICLIVGEGSLKNKLEEQIELSGLCKNIKLVGDEPHYRIPLWMNACDVFVLPSLNESFGLVQIEAMACGKPVVATYNGGSEEIIISNDYGYLVKIKDSFALAEKIAMSIETSWNKEKISDYAGNFTWNTVAEKLFEIYYKELQREVKINIALNNFNFEDKIGDRPD